LSEFGGSTDPVFDGGAAREVTAAGLPDDGSGVEGLLYGLKLVD